MTEHFPDANARRAARAGAILIHHRHGNDLRTSLVDLLADLRHWCDRNGADFHGALTQSYHHYLHERRGPPHDER
jgi:hypothetical protein